MEGLWSLITIVGPILLAAALIYAIVGNRRRSRAQRDITEQATHDQYTAADRNDAADRR